MQTIKTAIVVVLLLGVCYGAYVALNAPEPVLPPELDQWAENGGLDISVEDGAAISIPQLSGSAGGGDLASLTPPNIDPPKIDAQASSANASSKEPELSLPSSSIPAPSLPLANTGTSASTNSSPASATPTTTTPSSAAPTLALPSASTLASSTPSAGNTNAGNTTAGNTAPKLPELGGLPSLDLPPGVEGTSMPLGANSTANKSTAPPATNTPANASTSSPAVANSLGTPTTTAPLPGSNLASTPTDNKLPALPGMPALPGGPASTDPFPTPPSIDRMVSFAQPGSTDASAATGGNDLNPPQAVTPPGTSTSNAASNSATKSDSPVQPFAAARTQAIKLANDGKLRDALAMMTPYYNHIELTHEEHLDLIDLLDALAAEVVYSKRHLLEGPFTVSAGDTLESIANKYQISPETLASINRMGDSKIVLAGMQMKVLRGPFRGEVNLTRGELTLFLGNLYAGRFPISVGNDQKPVEGEYKLIDRRRDRSYVGKDSKYYAANDPLNPYGGYWMHLGNDISIHGSAATQSPELEHAGCISLAPLDARDVYQLLTAGSPVSIKR